MTTIANLAAAVAAGTALLGVAFGASAQSIAPMPADPNWRGTLGHPFPGSVYDIEVLDHNRFALAIDDGQGERVQVFTALGGFEGEPFVLTGEGAAIYDVVAVNGGYWIIWAADPGQPLTLRRFNGSGRPQGAEVVLDASTEARDARLFPLAAGALLVVWTQHRPSSPAPAPVSGPKLEGLDEALLFQVIQANGEASPAALIDESIAERSHIDEQSFPEGISLPDGGVVVGWTERRSETWERYPRFVRFDPAGKPVGSAQEVDLQDANGRRGLLELAPQRGAPGFAALVGVGFDLAIRRFGPDGSPQAETVVVPHESGSIRPLYVEGDEVVVTNGLYGPPGLQRLVGGERRSIETFNNRTSAHVIEAGGHVVLALTLQGGGMAQSHLYRIVME